jgi:hypothetical protein
MIFCVCQGVLVDAVALLGTLWNRIHACTLIGRELKGANFGADTSLSLCRALVMVSLR